MIPKKAMSNENFIGRYSHYSWLGVKNVSHSHSKMAPDNDRATRVLSLTFRETKCWLDEACWVMAAIRRE
jgi:hypothetical protein